MLITHDLAVVAGIADQVAVMQAGQIVESAPTQALFRNRKHPYTRQLFAASTHQPERVRVAPASDQPLLQVQDVVRDYALPQSAISGGMDRLRAVDHANLVLHSGESLGLIGESGCGKSTLTRAILGLDPLQGGQILLDGEPVRAGRAMSRAQRAKMQVVFQDPYGSFDPRWRVDRLVAEPIHLTGRPRDWRDHVAKALADVGIPADAMGRYIHEFSGGQRQRIAIARALIIRPRLIILDEAVSALDVRIRAQVLDLLARLRQEYGLAYLFISHDLSVVRQITDRVAIMDQGKIVETGPTQQVMDAPSHPTTLRLVAAAPKIPSNWQVLESAD